ncbi:MAG: Holliday junction branch migration protein RuvA [Candidatus Omnitrophica bacterium]|nr:Holliday junction branch migration protein RuvA [Candidatus Omnitrophota bacterium]
MYHYLNGTIIEKSATQVILDVNGVGYEIQIPVSTFSGLPALGQRVKLFMHFVVREDAQILYGFLTLEEKRIFQLLVSVSGVGPKTAVTALSGVKISQLKKAIAAGSVEVLKGVPGIGRKTAERIIVELREKMALEGGSEDSEESVSGSSSSRLIEDSIQALVALGYKRPNAKKAIDKVMQQHSAAELSIEELIRASLQQV